MIAIALLVAYVAAADPATTRQCVIDCARAQFGKPYVLATEGPDTFDCSGLVMFCYEKCGYYFDIRPHTYELIYMGKSVEQSELILADLVFPSSGHVQLYSGNGNIIHAPHSGSYVKEQAIYNWWAGRRLIGVDGDGAGEDFDGDTSTQTDGKRVTVTTTLNVRASASTSSESVAQYSAGETCPFDSYVYAEDKHWLSYIAGSGLRRYICSKATDGTCYTSPCATGGKGTTKALQTMNIRARATTESSVLGYLSEGDEITYDIVFTSGSKTWISWMKDDVRQYVCAKGTDGKEYVSPLPN